MPADSRVVEVRTPRCWKDFAEYMQADVLDVILRPVSYYAVCRRNGQEIETYGQRSMLHFVRFSDDRYLNAVRVFGRPDFIHRFWDRRAADEIAPGDTVVFAEGDEHQTLSVFVYDDSAFF